MKELTIKTKSAEYGVTVSPGLLNEVPQRLAEAFPKSRFAVITDETVNGIYGERLAAAMAKQDLVFDVFTVPPGESSKCIAVFAKLLSSLAQNKYNRADVIIAFGGGVVGDLAGYVAASYLRGIRYVQIPTTLLAQIDSSVGGKTGINLPEGKNLVGAFYQPSAVFEDTRLLQTLSDADFADGMAELIKYALIRDAQMFSQLENSAALSAQSDMLEDLIVRCISIKRDIVAADERDTGERMLLNFGHTVGHGIERICALRKQPMTHGTAVAMGMAALTAASERKGLTQAGTTARIAAVLKKAGLPYGISGFNNQDILEGILVDKKNVADTLHLVLISAPGQSFLHRIPRGDMADYL